VALISGPFDSPPTATHLYAGLRHACALRHGRPLTCWGANQFGQVGVPPGSAGFPSGAEPTPRELADAAPYDEVSAVALGWFHGCLTTPAPVPSAPGVSEIYCWGRNDSGQLGDGTTTSRPHAELVAGLHGPVTSLATGAHHSCALVDGIAWCWGANDRGQLGDGSHELRTIPVRVLGQVD
jgi:alpha-tubulin suppressor-like RCC1 family protein